MDEKKEYEKPRMEVIEFEKEEIITTSGDRDPNEAFGPSEGM